MVASGNDFVAIDNRKQSLKNIRQFARRVCNRNFGVGADGVLLLEKSKIADIRMRIINSDGSEPDMCGNGSRCAALYAHKILGFDRKFTMETKAGLIQCAINTWTVQVQLTDSTQYRSLSHLKVSGKEVSYYFVNTGVPHTVIIIDDDLESVPVEELGREIRNHSKFQPAGTNVNFVKKSGPRSLKVRTYERGVEGETLACGTGSTAAAIVAALVGLVKPPVEVKTKSGEVLKINFNQNADSVTNITLEGNAEFTFEGSLCDAI
jgi:diaminopimelate epimerase